MTKRLLALGMLALALSTLCFRAAGQRKVPGANVDVFYLEAWSGQRGKADQSPKAAIAASTNVACIEAQEGQAHAQTGQCYLTISGSSGTRTVTLKRRESTNVDTAGDIQLSCNGTSPTYCKIQAVRPKPPK
jgi:hypothetical protein